MKIFDDKNENCVDSSERIKVIDEILDWIESETFYEGRIKTAPGREMIVDHLNKMKECK